MRKINNTLKIIITGFITGILNGLFGSGGGTIVVPAMNHFLNVERHEAHATALAVILPITIISSFIYIRGGLFKPMMTVQVAAGGMIGGFIGAKLLKKISGDVLKKIFAVFMIIASIRMLV